jgi:hypothetical protein
MTFPYTPGPRPGPPPGGFRPQPPAPQPPAPQPPASQPPAPVREFAPQHPAPVREFAPVREPAERRIVEETGHPAVDAALRSLANAAALAPGEQIDAYEAAHQVLRETLASIEG